MACEEVQLLRYVAEVVSPATDEHLHRRRARRAPFNIGTERVWRQQRPHGPDQALGFVGVEMYCNLIKAVEDDQDVATGDKPAKINGIGLFAGLPTFAEDRVDQIVDLDMLEAAAALLQGLASEQTARIAHV